jgi:hypothetical protein
MKPPEGEIIKLNGLYNVANRSNEEDKVSNFD